MLSEISRVLTYIGFTNSSSFVIFITLVVKSLSALRLFKALFSFENPLDYLVWKIERHTGIRETPTDLQRKYPILFSWTLLWKIYKAIHHFLYMELPLYLLCQHLEFPKSKLKMDLNQLMYLL